MRAEVIVGSGRVRVVVHGRNYCNRDDAARALRACGGHVIPARSHGRDVQRWEGWAIGGDADRAAAQLRADGYDVAVSAQVVSIARAVHRIEQAA